MIIDIHSHIAFNQIYPSQYLKGMVKDLLADVNETKLDSYLSFFLQDKFCDRQLKQMDNAGIDKSLLLIIDGGIGMNEPLLPLDVIHQLHHIVLQNHPERFIVFAGIDPRRGDYGLELFKKSILDYGFSGLKLYPPMGYRMNDPRLYYYYQICSEKKLCVLIHTGPSLSELRNDFGNPLDILEVAKTFKDVNFILAHAGCRLFDPAVQAVLDLPNVYLDIAGFQSVDTGDNLNNMMELDKIFSKDFNKKILFGTDWPLFHTLTSLSANVEMIERLFELAPDKTSDGLENVLYKNALKALRLTE